MLAPRALRAAALVLLLLLLVNPAVTRARPRAPLVALDASASWLRAADSAVWHDALQRVGRHTNDSVLVVGAAGVRSMHYSSISRPPLAPADSGVRFSSLAERARISGRPIVLITDGEIGVDQRAAHAALPRGSRIDVIPVARGGDVALARLDAPVVALAGDTITVIARVIASGNPLGGGDLGLSVDGRVIADRELPPMEPWGRQDVSFQVVVPRGGARATLSAVLAIPGDREPRNDTATRFLRRGERIAAVAVTTSPDFDFRAVVEVLRGALSLPTRARFRVAGDRWVDENGRPVAESQVRADLAAAHVAVIHGDTGYFGAPRAIARGALALLVPPSTSAEWYVDSVPPSPVARFFRSLPFDSLAPVSTGSIAGGTPLLLARGPNRATRTIATGFDERRRVIVASVGGVYSWALRGGVSADALRRIWGAMFEWIAESPGSSANVPSPRFAPAELLPQRPTVQSGSLGEWDVDAERGRLRDFRWLFAVVALFLCAEWILRRRAGMR